MPDSPKHGNDKLGMGGRGVTRPMAEQTSQHHHEEMQNESGSHEMSRDDRLMMLKMHHKQTLWIYWTLPLLGIWMVLAPFTFGYLNDALWVNPSGGRGVWFSEQTHTELRAQLMTWSDVVSGFLLLVFGYRSLTPNRPKSLWTCCFLGVWLTFAPIVFWAPTAASYLNSTVVGMLLIALTILIPGMPNMIMYMQMGPPVPPGWSYNPSSWPQRWIMIVTGFLGFVVSRYLAMFQLGYIDWVWDPFFGFEAGTKPVLNSRLSHSLPISDAGLGAVSYTFEFLMGYMGSPSRWRTMPWMVAFFGILVIPLGLTHIVLVVSQPLIVHHWCFYCLIAALIMLPMIPLEVDEVVAMGQHMIEAKRRGDRGGSVWTIFWKGGSAEGCTSDERSPELIAFPEKPGQVFRASIWGMSFPWTLIVASMIGIGLMAMPSLFGVGIQSGDADLGHFGGALIVTVSVVCMGEVLRLGRYLNVLLGIAVAGLPWILDGGSITYSITCTIAGVLVLLLSLPRGVKTEQYGLWDPYVR
ncbi:vitamin K epoxide reductase family protein [Thalassoroseus pseudoceratinae]|uniref:vitamin K epoxide reductase family protein n=1 Tax=Thalassoroseus pseudoceratinae TaxID=2713176 RepID=UPI00197FB33B|nr:vitamin K epoxide reductase family protein [Thalassoroseus pseudoceratinae]